MGDAWAHEDVTAAGVRFSVRSLGRGERVVVLLHGWPETSAAWRRVAPILVAQGWRVVCPDLKGFGGSDAPRTGYDPPTLATELAALMTALDVPRAALVGHDWGGAVSLATALRFPERVSALVQVASPYRVIDLRAAWHIPLFNLPLLPEATFRLAGERLVRAALRHASEVPEAFDDVVAEYGAAVAAHPRSWLAYYRTMSRRVVTDRLRPSTGSGPQRPQAPVHVVWGAQDPATPRWVGERTAGDLGADLTVIEGTGHFPHEEDPRAFSAAVLAHIGAP